MLVQLEIFFLFLFGLVVGSFINVVVYRLNHGENPLKGRSFCPNCKHKLAWFDNIPLLSFILLRRKCRYCHSPISWQYPLTELAIGILFVGTYWWVKGWCEESLIHCYLVTLLHCSIVASLVAIFVSDLLYQTIPDQVSYPAIAVAFFYRYDFLLAGLGAGLFFLILHLITRGKGMAMGDVKLALLMGLFLGWPGIAVSLYLAFLTGALLGVILILIGRKKFGQPIPFGPFLTASALVAFFWGEKIIDLLK